MIQRIDVIDFIFKAKELRLPNVQAQLVAAPAGMRFAFYIQFTGLRKLGCMRILLCFVWLRRCKLDRKIEVGNGGGFGRRKVRLFEPDVIRLLGRFAFGCTPACGSKVRPFGPASSGTDAFGTAFAPWPLLRDLTFGSIGPLAVPEPKGRVQLHRPNGVASFCSNIGRYSRRRSGS